MPRKRRIGKTKTVEIGPGHIHQLLSGYGHHGGTYDFGRDTPHSECDHAGMRATWDELGAELLAEWIKSDPGTRPHAWWEYDAPEPKKCVSGCHPCDSCSRDGDMAQLFFGEPRMVITSQEADAIYEDTIEYLFRLRLLTNDELRHFNLPPHGDRSPEIYRYFGQSPEHLQEKCRASGTAITMQDILDYEDRDRDDGMFQIDEDDNCADLDDDEVPHAGTARPGRLDVTDQ